MEAAGVVALLAAVVGTLKWVENDGVWCSDLVFGWPQFLAFAESCHGCGTNKCIGLLFTEMMAAWTTFHWGDGRLDYFSLG